jgi:hypothetical protein
MSCSATRPSSVVISFAVEAGSGSGSDPGSCRGLGFASEVASVVVEAGSGSSGVGGLGSEAGAASSTAGGSACVSVSCVTGEVSEVVTSPEVVSRPVSRAARNQSWSDDF